MKNLYPYATAFSYNYEFLWAGFAPGALIVFDGDREIVTQTGSPIEGPMISAGYNRYYLGGHTNIAEWKYAENAITCV